LNQLVQLGALQLGCDRAILAFIDFQYEYVVAESTRLHTPAQRRAETHPELLVGVARLSHKKGEGMCPEVVQAFKDETGEYERNGPYTFANRDHYLIKDMREDPQYKNKPCISEFKPGIVSFIAVPVISPLGWVLGSYMIGHSEVCEWSDDAVEILREISKSIVQHLELVKAKHDRARSEKLMKGLAEFMERDSPVPHERTLSMSTRTSEKSHSEAPDSVHSDPAEDGQAEEEEGIAPDEVPAQTRPLPHSTKSSSTVRTATSSEVMFSPDTNGSSSTPPSTPPEETNHDPFDNINPLHHVETHDEHEEESAPPTPESTISEEVKRTFERAAAVISDAMNTDGMMFIDAVPSGFGARSEMNTPYEKQEDPFVSDTAESTSNEAEDVVLSKYLAKWTQPWCPKPQNSVEGHGPISEPVLKRWIKRYPRGHIFTADEYGPIDCRYGPGNSILKTRRVRRRSSRVMNDVAELFEQFPHVRYVIFLPLWHFQRECWFAAAFGWVSFESQQALDYSDLNLLTAFCNSIMAEVSRIEALSVSRAKSDFISSISHELRSPLHGILASGELLREALDDPNLLSMIDMIDSCGTTLLDTFNNLLDYAKINVSKPSGESEEEENNKHGRRIRRSETKTTDLSLLVQDVVEAVNLGHLSKTAFQNNQSDQAVFTSLAELAEAEEDFPDHSVIVTTNIEKRPSWMTKLDPGAWKRIVMNIVGNALKYTRAGHVEIGLKLCDVPSERKRGVTNRNICFSVRDTGIGMSADYLKYQLFTPFAQENNLSPGTGLGLSIVNQIVKGLGGTLDVQSQIGIGTHMKVFVPLNPDTAGPLGQQMPPIDEVSQFDTEGKLQGRTLHVITPAAYKALVNPQLEITQEIRDRFRVIRTSLRHTAEETLGMKVAYDMPTEHNEADIYFFDAYIIGKAMHGKLNCAMHKSIVEFSPLVILCSGAGPLNQLKNEKLKGKMLHLRHPIGPKKLATTFLSALKVGKLQHPLTWNDDDATPCQIKHKEPEVNIKEIKADVTAKNEQQNSQHEDIPRRPEPNPIQSHQPVVPHHITSTSSPAVLTGNTASQTQHLLLVDDNPINLKILTTLVKKLKHTYETASNGLEAVQLYKASLIQNHQFDFVFMDISMPVMNGFEATREIRRCEKEEKVSCAARIAALTGLGSEQSRQEAFASGTNLFLTKPVKLGEIKKLLDHEQVRGEEVAGG
jgi:signal transduction histidine kinase/CheY-like chemotaxis protein